MFLCMNKRGDLEKLEFIYLVIVVVILITLLGVVSAAKDDSGYKLKFYSIDIAYSIEGLLWTDETVDEVFFVYLLEEGYVVSLGSDKVIVKKDRSIEEKNFRTRKGYDIKIKKLPAEDNLYLFKRVMK